MSPRQILGACVICVYLLILGFLGGMAASAMQFDGRRAAILSKLDDASGRVHAHLMRLEHEAARAAASPDEAPRPASLDPDEARRVR